MLGTEQVNLIPRMITPLLEGVESIRVTDQVAKSMGLVDNQIVRGVVEDLSLIHISEPTRPY